MDRNYHVFSNGRLERHQDTLRLVTEDGEKKPMPIENTEAVYLHGQVDFNTRLVGFLNDNGVAAHVFGWHDYYSGSVMPERGQTSGQTLVAQVRAYEDATHRQDIATSFVRGSIHNMRANVAYYDGRRGEFGATLDRLDAIRERVLETDDVPELMGVEATARKAYYETFDRILDDEFDMGTREYNPPRTRLTVYSPSVTRWSMRTACRPSVRRRSIRR